jgi:putative hydrolase of the HAD superfamily
VLKTIIFDMGNVLIPFDFRRGYTALQEHVSIPPEDIPARIRATGLVREFESGRIEPEAFVTAVTKALGTRIPYEEFCDIWSTIFLEHELVPADLVRHLRRTYRVIVLSNTNAIHFNAVWKTYPILREFDHLVLSHEVKSLKPEPEIYAEAIKQAKARPEECFFTDDIPEYVEGARKAGIQAEQFTGYEKLLADLRARGVEV